MEYGLIPEFIGRLPVVAAIHQLSRDDLITILTEPKHALTKQFQRFFEFDDIELVFAEDSLEAIANKALERETGARGLRSILEETLLDVQFELPSRRDVTKCVVTKETIAQGRRPTLVTEAAQQDIGPAERRARRGNGLASVDQGQRPPADPIALGSPRTPTRLDSPIRWRRTERSWRRRHASIRPRSSSGSSREWIDGGYFHPEAEGDPVENFRVTIPPPNVTGALHMGHALNGSIQDALVRMNRMRGRNSLWVLGHRPRRDRHPGRGRERAPGRRGHAPGARPGGLRRAGLGLERGLRLADRRAVQAARRLLRLRAGALHPRRGLRPRRLPRLQAALRQGLHLPRQLHGQLGPRHAFGDLRPRGREPRGRGRPLLDRLPGRGLRSGPDRRHRPPGDDARRHRRRREPRRRALRRPGRQALRSALGGPPPADHRRRARRRRVRDRRPEDHPRPRRQRLRDRPQARARGDRRDRARRTDHGGCGGAPTRV